MPAHAEPSEVKKWFKHIQSDSLADIVNSTDEINDIDAFGY